MIGLIDTHQHLVHPDAALSGIRSLALKAAKVCFQTDTPKAARDRAVQTVQGRYHD